MIRANKSPVPIDETVTEWRTDLDTALPINGGDIPGFVHWVNGNGFNFERESRKGHDGYDFGAYLRDDGIVVLGLPKETPIRAVASGIVRQVMVGEMTGGSYGGMVKVEHGKDDSGMFSSYIHVESDAQAGAKVERGEAIGTLHQDSGSTGRLVHLHLSLLNGWESYGGGASNRLQDPRVIDDSLYDLTPDSQNWEPFDPITLGAKALLVANFDTVLINDTIWK